MVILLPIALTVAFFGCGGDDPKSINTPSNDKSNTLRTPQGGQAPINPGSENGSQTASDSASDDKFQPLRSSNRKPPRHKPPPSGPKSPASPHTQPIPPVTNPRPEKPVLPSRPEPPRPPEAPMAPETPRDPEPVNLPPPPPRTHLLVNGPAVQEAADGIGAVYRNRSNWQEYTLTVAELLTRPALDHIHEANMDDFWTRAQGASVLWEAIGDVAGCPVVGYDNACHALMMLVGNMILTNDHHEVGYFFQETGITAFIRDRAAQLAEKLSRSEANSLNANVYLGSGISRIAEGMVKGYAAKWAERFPEILMREPDEQRRLQLPRIVVMHGLHRVKALDPARNRMNRMEGLMIERNRVLGSFAAQLARFDRASVRMGLDDRMGISYVGEHAVGAGVTREWFPLMQDAINQSVLKVRPESNIDQLDPDAGIPDNELKAIGTYFALCIIHDRPTSLNMPVGFFKLLGGQIVTVEDISEIDRESYNSLNRYARELTQEEFDAIGPGVALPHSGTEEPLTLANKDQQISQAIRNIITNDHFGVFNVVAGGLFEIIPREIFRGLSGEQFKGLISATGDIAAEDFLRHTVFVGNWLPNRQDWLRETIRGFSQARLRKILRFITGFETLPAGGFDALPRAISIGGHSLTDLPNPRSHTCFATLDWPQYDDLRTTRETLTNLADLGHLVEMDEGWR